MTLHGVITPASLCVMTQTPPTIGQQVRYIGSGATINARAIGTVTRLENNCPIVDFPGTRGPYREFLITNPARDLEPVR